MDENKQFDNNGAEIAEPPVSPAPHYHHLPPRDSHGTGHGGRCAVKEDAFVLRIKWKHIKLAALLLAAFMLGSLYTRIEYSRNSYGKGWNNVFGVSENIRIMPSAKSFSIEIPAVSANEKSSYSNPQFHFSSPESEMRTNYENGIRQGTHGYYR